MSNSNNNDDGWQTASKTASSSSSPDDFIQQPPKRTSKHKRVYVGNLRLSSSSTKEELSTKLRDHFEQSAIKIPPNGIEVISINSTNSSSAYALIECSDVNEAIKRCDQSRFDGRTIRVSRERKNVGTKGGGGGGKKGFGSAGWSKPRASKSKPSFQNNKSPAKVASSTDNAPQFSQNENETTQQNTSTRNDDNIDANDATDDLISTSETVKSIVLNEIEQNSSPPGDEMNSVLASVAALGVMSCVMNMNDENENEEDKKEDNEEEKKDRENPKKQTNSLLSGNAASLSTLLADYGEQDLNFKVESTKKSSSTPNSTSQQQQQQVERGILAPQSKAPIQITIASFGYKYGVPSSYKQNGWSYSNPLAPFDCRDVKEVPKYLHKCSGLSYRVKRLMLQNDYGEKREQKDEEDHHDLSTNNNNNDDDDEEENEVKQPSTKNPIKRKADEIASAIHSVILEAINEGVASYASPLATSVYIGSTHGKHRSVVLTELTAQSLRTLLRKTTLEGMEVLVSVGTLHRDVDREYSLEDYIEEQEGSRGDEGMEIYYGMDGMKEKRKGAGGSGKRRGDRRRR